LLFVSLLEMPTILAATESGFKIFSGSGEVAIELAERRVGALAVEREGACLAIVDEKEIWRRAVSGAWAKLAVTDLHLQSLTSADGTIYAGGMDEAVVLRIRPGGLPERLDSFDHVPGRREWFAGGPPLGVRSLAVAGNAILAGVHVGGVPRSVDEGDSWQPTMPVMFDVHELCAHPTRPEFAAAAAAVGLCISRDGGQTWTVVSEQAAFPDSLKQNSSLAVAVLDDQVLFSVQDGPFANRSQVWKWHLRDEPVEQVRDGLPEWLVGRVDTCGLAVGHGRAAVADTGGNLWLSTAGSSGWRRFAEGLGYVWGLAIVETST
jgi:hypothetical protein